MGTTRLRSRLCAALSLLLLAAGNEAQRTARQEPRLTSPIVRLEQRAAGHVIATYDEFAYTALAEAHERGGSTRLTDLPLPDGRSVDLRLTPTTVMAPGARAVVVGPGGETRELAPSVRTFRATLPGRAGRAFLGVGRTQLNGYVTLGADTYFLTTGGAAPGRLQITDAAILPDGLPADWCGVSDDEAPEPTPLPSAPGEDRPPGALSASAGSDLFVQSFRLQFELDHEYRALFPSDQAAIDYAVLLASATSDLYRRDLGVVFEIPNHYLRLWTTEPPWGTVVDWDELGAFRQWWNSAQNPIKNRQRAAVVLFTTPVFGGIANGIGVLCRKLQSYQMTSVFGSFPYPVQHTSPGNNDLQIFAHEMGHLAGSIHAFLYSPPITCVDGSGPDEGTFMNYCRQTQGIGKTGMRFHERVQDTIRSAVADDGCAGLIGIQSGDYDMNGVLDAADLAQFDALQTQGFVSRGAEETFDLDGNGVVDAADRDLLQLSIDGPVPRASVVERGTSNCACGLLSSSLPILGRSWETALYDFGPDALTAIVATTAAHDPPLPTRWGDLTIQLPGPGVPQAFKSLATTSGYQAFHSVAIPYDLSLVGLSIHAQGVVFRAEGARLTNGFDLVLSLY